MITFSNQTNVNNVLSFEELLTKMMPFFHRFAKCELRLKGDNYDECIQELTCMSYENYKSLVDQDRADEIFYSPIMRYAMLRVRCSRSYLGINTTDVFSKGTQLKGRSELRPIHLMPEHNDPKEYLVDHKMNVSRAVAFKLDFFENFLPKQTQQNQEIIHDLMMGECTSDIAKKFGVSPGRISQLKRQFANDWYALLYPPEETDFLEELRALAEAMAESMEN